MGGLFEPGIRPGEWGTEGDGEIRLSQLRLGAIPHLNEPIQISFANEEFNGHRLTSEIERGDGKVVMKMKCGAQCHAIAIPPARLERQPRAAARWEAGPGLTSAPNGAPSCGSGPRTGHCLARSSESGPSFPSCPFHDFCSLLKFVFPRLRWEVPSPWRSRMQPQRGQGHTVHRVPQRCTFS